MTKKNETMSSKEISRKLFRKNLATEIVEIKNTDIKFKVQALPEISLAYIRKESSDEYGKTDDLKITSMFVKFGLIEASGITDEDDQPVSLEFETIHILNTPVQCLTDAFVSKLSRILKINLASIISEISELTNLEQMKLEFFRKSGH
jgi:hypothetical protein